MMNRLSRASNFPVARIARHLAFVVIGAAILAEALFATTVIASSGTTESLIIAEPFYRVQFATVAAFSSLSAYAGQLLNALSVSNAAHSVGAFVSERLQHDFAFKIQLDSSTINI